ncbi:hypothetical protein FN846DRAFT_974803 [Sphaerosporella brunnea]|uniref:Uncharacterized protein n=1 Tax=Sphaerosporella brunnea TaxID=1250544 RepID=A0A5J5EHV3_9PEZI|nr:hypothetical protein FN846DRAFT_974803 [Sphaerosporella brunnea]
MLVRGHRLALRLGRLFGLLRLLLLILLGLHSGNGRNRHRLVVVVYERRSGVGGDVQRLCLLLLHLRLRLLRIRLGLLNRGLCARDGARSANVLLLVDFSAVKHDRRRDGPALVALVRASSAANTFHHVTGPVVLALALPCVLQPRRLGSTRRQRQAQEALATDAGKRHPQRLLFHRLACLLLLAHS